MPRLHDRASGTSLGLRSSLLVSPRDDRASGAASGRHRCASLSHRPRIVTVRQHRGILISAGMLLGSGLGGFVDGILLHQILQWHNMLSSKVAPSDLVAM